MTRRTSVVGCIAVVLLLYGCSGEEPTAAPSTPAASTTGSASASPSASTPPSDPATTTASPAASSPEPATSEPVAVTDVATGLDSPWDLAFLGNGTALVSERDSGRILEVSREGDLTEVQQLQVDPTGEGGLLGLAVDPEDGDVVYAYLSTSQDNRVVRLRPGEEPEPILAGIPHGSIHNGGRIAFGPDGLLYVGTGDAGRGELAQDRSSLGGKILRIEPDGSVPDGNPFGNEVLSLGHRNVQGLAWDAEGRLYAAEFGPDVDDEINLIEAGGNYGWPDVTGAADSDELIDPLVVRQPPDASWSGAALSADPAIPQWAGDLLVASLRGERLWHIPLTADGDVGEPRELLVGEHGRLRTAAYAPDGSLWLVTSNTDGRGSPREGDDRILRLAPEE